MTEVMVSIRMPKSLSKKLKEQTTQEDFLDLSEMIRSLVRKKWMEHTSPELAQIKKLREGIELEIKKKSIEKVQKEVANELEKIKAKLKGGGLLE